MRDIKLYTDDWDAVVYIATTYETITPESAEFGEAEDRGYESDEDGDPYTLDEIIQLLRGTSPSCHPCYGSPGDWFVQYGDPDPFTGAVKNLAYHLRSNNPSAVESWRKAAVAAGVARERTWAF